MRAAGAAGLLLAVCGSAQEGGAAPQEGTEGALRDARSLVRWHLSREQGIQDWDTLQDMLNVYFHGGAYGEALAAAERMEALDPGNPDVLRYRIYLDRWHAQRLAEPIQAAAEWLAAAHASLPVYAKKRDEVEGYRAQWQGELLQRERVRALARRSRWAPLGALAVLGLFLWHVARATR